MLSLALRPVIVLVAFGVSAGLAQTPDGPRQISPTTIPVYRVPNQLEMKVEVTAPTAQRPLGACESAMRRVVWVRCLRDTADLSDRLVESVTAQVEKSIEDRPSGQRRFWLQTFNEGVRAWQTLRDRECFIASAEAHAYADSYDARLACRIRMNRVRIEDLSRRFAL